MAVWSSFIIWIMFLVSIFEHINYIISMIIKMEELLVKLDPDLVKEADYYLSRPFDVALTDRVEELLADDISNEDLMELIDLLRPKDSVSEIERQVNELWEDGVDIDIDP